LFKQVFFKPSLTFGTVTIIQNTSGSSSSSIFSHSDKTATKRSRSPSAADLAIALTKPNRNNDREGSYNDHKHNKRDGKGRNSDEVMTTLNNGSVAKRAATQLEHDMRKLFAARHDLRVMRMFREALNKVCAAQHTKQKQYPI
jgi:hypothetical protein